MGRWWVYGWCYRWINSTQTTSRGKALNVHDGLLSKQRKYRGPILCGKLILKSPIPSPCPTHFQKAEKHVVRALKKAGLNVTSPNKVAPKLHVVVPEYVRQIQYKRRAAKRAAVAKVESKEENTS